MDVENAFAYFYLGMAHTELGNATLSAENLSTYERLTNVE
jgi:hypothetical protein